MHAATFLSDGLTIVLGGEDAEGALLLELRDVQTWRHTPAPWRPRGVILHQSPSADGRLLAVAYHGRRTEGGRFYGVQLFDLTTGRERFDEQVSLGVLTCVTLSPDGRTLVYSFKGPTIVCRDTADGAERARFHGAGNVHGPRSTDAVFEEPSPAGSMGG